MPTVVDAATLVSDTLDSILGAMLQDIEPVHPLYSTLDSISEEDRYQLIAKLIHPGNMFVTPKEIDETITRLATIIADMLNIALHPGVTDAFSL